MNKLNQIIAIYTALSEKLEAGTQAFSVAHKLIAGRVAAEETFTKALTKLIPNQYDTSDPLQQCLVDQLKKEIEIRNKFANEVRMKIKRPNKTFAAELKKRGNILEKFINRENHKVIKIQSDCDKITAELAKENAAFPNLPPQKIPAAQKKIEKLQKELESKTDEGDKIAAKNDNEEIPEIRKNFGEYEKDRLKKMKSNAVDFGSLKQTMEAQVCETTLNFIGKTKWFDDADTQERFMESTISGKPSQKLTLNGKGDEDDTVWGYAQCDFRSGEVTDLEFDKGDKIKVLSEHTSGWWDGELGGKKGTFPRSFIWIPGSDQIKGFSVNAFQSCRKNYRFEDFVLYEGDDIYIEIFQDDRICGKNERTGKKGWFPAELVLNREKSPE